VLSPLKLIHKETLVAKEEYDGKKPNRLAKSGYKTKYPHNQAFLSKAGHEIHVDNTPGSERIRVAHKSGSYVEINPDGAKVEYTVGHSQSYHKGGHTETFDHNKDSGVRGHQRDNVHGGKNSTSKGDSDSVAGGHINVIVVGNAKIAVAGDGYMGVKGNMNMNIKGNMSMKVAGSTSMETKGTHSIKAAKIALN